MRAVARNKAGEKVPKADEGGQPSEGNFAPFFSAAAKRSPTFASRFGIVRMLYFFGSSFLLTSSHFSGAETGAPSIARGDYGATLVFPYAFCMQSRYSRPWRFVSERSIVIVGTCFVTAAATEHAQSFACSWV